MRPQHLERLSAPLIVAIALLIWIMGIWDRAWPVVPLLFGMELFDLGWHSAAHHRELWLARPWVRIVGVLLCVAMVLTLRCTL